METQFLGTKSLFCALNTVSQIRRINAAPTHLRLQMMNSPANLKVERLVDTCVRERERESVMEQFAGVDNGLL